MNKGIMIACVLLIAIFLTACDNTTSGLRGHAVPASMPTVTVRSPATSVPVSTIVPFDMKKYAFPETINPARKYMFYLHGRIVEDQGLLAVDPVFGPYDYTGILARLASTGFTVISEQHSTSTDAIQYAERVAGQAQKLLEAGVPPGNISVIGASKGAAIAIIISNKVNDPDVNYILLGTCHPDVIAYNKHMGYYLTGNVLAIYDSIDEYAGSCTVLFAFSEGKGLNRNAEIILHIGTGHGILYSPLDEWVLPAVDWANGIR